MDTELKTQLTLDSLRECSNGSVVIAVESIDFIVQRGSDHDMDVQGMLAANGTIGFQLTDQNPGTVFIAADDHSLIASGCVNIDVANNIASHSNDFFPDEWGPANLSEAFMVVNDTLYLVAGNDGAAIGASSVRVSVRIRCRVVKLSKIDWMSIAIQSTAES